MLFLKQMVASIYAIILYVLVFVTLVDIVLVCLIKNRKPLLENKYFDLHRRCGFFKVTAFKVVAALLVSYLILNPPLVPGATIVIVVCYFLIVTKLLIDFVRKEAK